MKRTVEVMRGEARLRLPARSVRACLQALDRHAGYTVPAGSIGVAFVDPPACGRLHGDFFGDPEPTDVMTFPGDPGDNHAGDIAVCPAVALAACRESGLPFVEELTLYLVHAWLHLAGLSDQEPAAAARMREAEGVLMHHLRREAALLDASWKA